MKKASRARRVGTFMFLARFSPRDFRPSAAKQDPVRGTPARSSGGLDCWRLYAFGGRTSLQSLHRMPYAGAHGLAQKHAHAFSFRR